MEQWKDIHGYEGIYQVSSLGRIKSKRRNVWINKKGFRLLEERILKPSKSPNGYHIVALSFEDKTRYFSVHTLVAKAFIENDNPKLKTTVNHKNEVKTDNRVENLEWLSQRDNNCYGSRIIKATISNAKPIIGIQLSTGLKMHFYSATQTHKILGINRGDINKCCLGKQKTAGGFTWQYTNKHAKEV